jgi:hypothetical protein
VHVGLPQTWKRARHPEQKKKRRSLLRIVRALKNGKSLIVSGPDDIIKNRLRQMPFKFTSCNRR